jgi:hypothetical protein
MRKNVEDREAFLPPTTAFTVCLSIFSARPCHILCKMAPYDSDSSDGEGNDYTVTNVLLGYPSEEARDDAISHLGGRPVRSDFFLFSFFGGYFLVSWLWEYSFFSVFLECCRESEILVLTFLFPDLDRPVYPAIGRPREMQSMPRYHGPSLAVKWRAPRLPRTRETTVRPDMPAQDLQA